MMRRITMAALAAPLGVALIAPAAIAAPSPASAPATSALGNRSLATVLNQDGLKFDHNSRDYDIVHAAVAAVLKANPKSKVAVLADGNTALTAFIPNDLAFKRLLYSLTHKWQSSEQRTFAALAKKLGVKTIENVLLYHVVPGKTITAAQALKSDGAKLNTALGKTFRVDVMRNGSIQLIDRDPNAYNPWVVQTDINKGNKQIAHGISRVLRPVDL